MLIALVFDAFPSPSETFLAREVAALQARGLDVMPCAWRPGEGAQHLPFSNSPASKLARRLRGEAWWREDGARWARAWKQNTYPVGHIHAAWASFPSAWAQGAARELGVSWSFAGHARDVWVEGGDLKGKLGDAAFATACTRAGAERLRELSPRPERVLYAPHGLPLGEWPLRPERVRDSSRPFQILSVGRLVPKKGFDTLLQALFLWNSEDPHASWQATIIGDGPERGRLEASCGGPLEDRVHFPGARSGAEVRAAMEEADVFVLPCRVARDGDRDGLPNVLLEAAATGVPLLVGDAGGVRDFCDDREEHRNALLFGPESAFGLKRLLRQAWSERHEPDSRWQRAAGRAREKVEREFDIARTVQVLAEALEQSVQDRAK